MGGTIQTLAGLANVNKTLKTVIVNGAAIMLAKSGAAASHTGDSVETALATIPVPANTLGANGILRVTSFWTMTNSANVKNIRHRLGGLAGTVLFSAAPTAIGNMRVESTTLALNATNSQTSVGLTPRGTDLLVTEMAPNASTLDMTQIQSLVLTGQLVTTSETITLVGYLVDYFS